VRINIAVKTRPQQTRGFTAIELISGVAIILLLCTMLLPALAKSRKVDQTVICQRNMKELMMAWQLYSSSYDGRLCNNFTIPGTLDAISRKAFDNWANNIMD